MLQTLPCRPPFARGFVRRLQPRRCALLLAAALGSACATAPRATVDEPVRATSLAHRNLKVSIQPAPAFYADTVGRRMFGLLGVLRMRSAGNEIVSSLGLVDPANTVAGELKSALSARHGIVETQAAPADLELVVDTLNWDFRPFRGHADRMYVVYSAQARLIDLHGQRTLATGRCRTVRAPEAPFRTVDALLADQGRLLQTELRNAGVDCARLLASRSFLPVVDREAGALASAPVSDGPTPR